MSGEDDMIKRVRIQNFRSLVDVTVDLDPLTVLIGRSGTGKSNFVQAIRFLRDCLNTRNGSAVVNAVGGLHRVLHVDHLGEPLEYNLRFSIARIGESFEYSLRVNPSSTQVLEEYLKLGEKPLFHQADGKWVHAPE